MTRAATTDCSQAPFFNALCIDVDDLCTAMIEYGRVVRNPIRAVADETKRVLDHLADLGLHATFFIPGHVSRDDPGLVREIARAGHEIASHGERHCRVITLGREGFLQDASVSRQRLEDLVGCAVETYKAPAWSLEPDCAWAYDILAEAGYRYDHSATPAMKRALMRDPSERRPFLAPSGVIVIPPTCIRFAGRTIMMAGGFCSKYVPAPLLKRMLARINDDGLPFNYYFHPFEHSPAPINAEPRFKDSFALGLYTLHLGGHRKQLEVLNREFAFAPLHAAYASYVSEF